MTPLRQRMTEDMQVRNLALNTQTSYVQQVSLFARYFNKSPDQLGPEDIRAYQLHLTNEKKLAPGSVLIAVAALRFLYKVSLKKDWTFEDAIPGPKKPQKLPVVLSPEEILRFLGCVGNTKHRTILTTCYAAGLRISEAVHLKPTDIDSQRMVIRVEQGKGQKDRYVMFSPKLLETLRSYWRAVRPDGGWIFEGDMPGQPITRNAVELACQKARRVSGIRKPISPHSMSVAQWRVMNAIEVCRTAALGGHLERCDQCGYERNAFNSCRDRHCPKCQGLARAQWIDERQSELLETDYFHVVFTVPEEIASITHQNKDVVYGILFQATAETLKTIAADPKHLGAEIGFFAVLHSWGQNLPKPAAPSGQFNTHTPTDPSAVVG
jgi:integrase/recombinase XerD